MCFQLCLRLRRSVFEGVRLCDRHNAINDRRAESAWFRKRTVPCFETERRSVLFKSRSEETQNRVRSSDGIRQPPTACKTKKALFQSVFDAFRRKNADRSLIGSATPCTQTAFSQRRKDKQITAWKGWNKILTNGKQRKTVRNRLRKGSRKNETERSSVQKTVADFRTNNGADSPPIGTARSSARENNSRIRLEPGCLAHFGDRFVW